MTWIIAGLFTLFGAEGSVDGFTHWDLNLSDGKTISEHTSYRTCSKEKEALAGLLEIDLDQLTCKISRTYGE